MASDCAPAASLAAAREGLARELRNATETVALTGGASAAGYDADADASAKSPSAESEAHDRFHFNGQRGKRGCVNKQRGSRVLINDPRGTRGHGNNTEGTKKKSSPMISGAQF